MRFSKTLVTKLEDIPLMLQYQKERIIAIF